MMAETETVLIIDDDVRILQSLSRNLNLLEYQTLTAAGGEIALDLYAKNRPDIVMVDVCMPYMDGFAVLEKIHKMNPDAEVILITGQGDMDMAITALRRGASDFLAKPVEQTSLEAALHRAQERLKVKRKLKETQKALKRGHETLEISVAERTRELTEANARLQVEIAERNRLKDRLAAAYQIGHELILSHEEADIIQRTLNIAAQILRYDHASCILLDKITGALIRQYDLDDGKIRTTDQCPFLDNNRGMLAVVIEHKLVLNIPDTNWGPKLTPNHRDKNIRSALYVPMLAGEYVIGLLTIESAQTMAFNDADEELLQILGMQAAVALENARLYMESQYNAHELAAINKAMHAMTTNLKLSIVLQQAIREIHKLLKAEDASVLLYDSGGQDLVFAAIASENNAGTLFGRHLPADTGIAGWVFRNCQPVRINNVQKDPRFYNEIDGLTDITTRSLLAVPLSVKGNVIGVIEVINKNRGHFSAHELELLETLASSAAIAIDNARLYQDQQDQMRLLRETQGQLLHSEKIAALGRLAASISHEINNPLQSIQGCLTLASEELLGEQRTQKLERYLNVAEEEIERIANIVRRIRDFYRPAPQELYSTHPHTVLESVLELVNKQLQHSQVAIECAWDRNLPPIYANADHLKQVFLNLVLNAIDAMPDGGTLYIRTWADEDNVYLEFTDTGIGMSEETQARLFEPFFTTKPQGSGLGLSISYGIIEAHKGKISVVSQHDVGTTFTISLPQMNT